MPEEAYKHLHRVTIEEMKRHEKDTQTELEDKQKEIDKDIKKLKAKGMLPSRFQERYEKRFLKKDEKKAFLITSILFFICIIIATIAQPSIFFKDTTSGLFLKNYSGRELQNVKVFGLMDYANSLLGVNAEPLLAEPTLQPNTQIQISTSKSITFIAFADKQLPMIGISRVSQGINTSLDPELTRTLYKGLKTQIEGDKNA